MHMTELLPPGVMVLGEVTAQFAEILTPEALGFVARLHRRFEPRRQELLARRAERQREFDSGLLPDFLPQTKKVRESEWQVAPQPRDLLDRRVEITGPTDRKMVINALNCGASTFMADFEDANCPTWHNMVDGQVNLRDAVRRTIRLEQNGRQYRLNDPSAVLIPRPRGWHLDERHLTVDRQPVSGALFDFALFFFHNARELVARGSGPYFYLPKLESHLEARLWNEVFDLAQDELGILRGTVRATVLIETILAAFEMDEILYELRHHAAGLNAGRWDYLFSVIKNFRDRPEFLLPDRSQLTMTVPFMQAYTELLVKTCHRRGAHAIGGMAAFIPSRRDPEINRTALARVREDKKREVRAGYDGAWVAHPDLVPVVAEVFGAVLQDKPHQKERQRDDVVITREQLLDVRIPGGRVTEAGLRNNIAVGLQYLAAWLGGSGAVAINNLMEDAATAEISRSQLWQWIHHGGKLDDGRPVAWELVKQITDEEMAKLPADEPGRKFQQAREIFWEVAMQDDYIDFLTLQAYGHVD